MNDYTCCFTGHRIIATRDRAALIKDLRTTIETLAGSGMRQFICGGALGFDTMAAIEVLRLKAVYPDITLSLALPCRDQAARWNAGQRKLYDEILQKADHVEYMFDNYVNGCMQMRNRYMVDHADVCVAYYNGRPGGTGGTVAYAKEKGVRLIFIPAKEETKWEI
ncbi:MAG: DUF1273 family protein [Clostridia bacterium]|nr:DUF1273 family protein [Clostridia bacterium]